ncbi:MAG: transposase [Desulfovibrio sp.]|nr:transposase [Desulfovibrio sp.]
MNKSIPDQAFGFRRQPGYSLTWICGIVLLVPPQYTSRTCCNCGCTDNDKRPSRALFNCTPRGC